MGFEKKCMLMKNFALLSIFDKKFINLLTVKPISSWEK